MDKIYIQPQRFKTEVPKSSAITLVENYVNGHISEFKNGELIVFDFTDEFGVERSSNATVIIANETASVIPSISEGETLKIVEKDGDEGLEDTDAIWLSDNWDEEVDEQYGASDLKGTVKQMARELSEVKAKLALCIEALTNTLGGGNIIVNSTKYELENEYEPERPEYAPDPYTSGDTNIYTWNAYIGNSTLSAYTEGGLYAEQRYYPKVRAFNSAGEEIEITSAMTVTMSCSGGSARATFSGKTLYSETSGDTNFIVRLVDEEQGFDEEKTYLLTFEIEEKPDYQTYNVKHLLVKHAESEAYMLENQAYLLVGEFCWCIKESSLYLKEQAPNGSIQIFKINGGGSITPSGETITYVVTDGGVLQANSDEGSVYVDESGILTLVGSVDDNGVLHLNDTQSN